VTARSRMTCPKCGRDVAATTVRGPRVNRGRPIPPLRVPVAHKPPEGYDGPVVAKGASRWCPAGERQ
jgi:hypothetical protein